MPSIKFSLLALILPLTLLASSSSSIASDNYDQQYFTIGEVEIIDYETETSFVLPMSQEQPADLSDIGKDITEIINIGKKIWKIIEANRPVVNVKTDSATILPVGIQSALQLEGWSMPQSKRYGVAYKNLFGMEVVKFDFRFIYTYGGSLDGKGKYLANVTMVPADLQVSWGFKFNADAKVVNMVNVGTKEDPVVGAELLLDWSVDTVFKHQRQTVDFFVQGDGKLNVIK